MKIFVIAATAVATLSAVHAAEQSSLHLRIHGKGGACTITNESHVTGKTGPAALAALIRTMNAAGRTTRKTSSAARKSKARASTTKMSITTVTMTSTSILMTSRTRSNWTGSTSWANCECRWSDDGQNVKRYQKMRG
ncbi:hypothetical protein GQ600_12059 [Phytophthora cactorum]|nr:hypothetical protein GQ600_12059 [Phytophthora cactorum]